MSLQYACLIIESMIETKESALQQLEMSNIIISSKRMYELPATLTRLTTLDLERCLLTTNEPQDYEIESLRYSKALKPLNAHTNA